MKERYMKKIREWISVKTAKAPTLVVILCILAANIVFLSIAALVIMKLVPPSLENNDYWSCVYYAVTMLATGYMEIIEDVGETGVVLIIFCMFTVIIGMIVLTGAVIGYVTEFISSFISDADAGSRKLYISNHIVILNWNTRAAEIINELLYKNVKEKVVILVDDNKEDVLNDIDERISDTLDDENEAIREESKKLKFGARNKFLRENKLRNRVTIIVREGETWSTKQLSDISIEQAKSIIILSSDDADTSYEHDSILERREKGNENTIKTLLQVTHLTSEAENENAQLVVVEVENDWTLTLVETIMKQKSRKDGCIIVPVATNQILGQVFSQFSIMPELNIVYSALFSNKGASIYAQVSDEYSLTEEEFVEEYLKNHLKAIPLTVIHDEDGKYYRYYLSDSEQSIDIVDSVKSTDSEKVTLSINPDFEITDRHVIILGHNSKSNSIMEGFEAFCGEWQVKDAPDVLDITIIDDEENLVKQDNYERYPFVKNIIAAGIYDKDLVCNVIGEFIDKSNGKGCIIILSDDTVPDENIDADVLTYLVLIQDIINERSKDNADFDSSQIDLVVEILNPKNYDIISNYSTNNIVISNRYISKMIMQVSEKESIFNFYDDILNYDIPGEEVFISKEIYVKKVSEFFIDIPKPSTAAELIRAVYNESPPENKSVVLGYFNSDNQMTLFGGDQTSIKVSLSENDKLIMFSNH